MKNKPNEAVEVNEKMNKVLQDGKVHASPKGRTESEEANMEMQDRFRGEEEQPAEGVAPAFIYNPSMNMNPEDDH